MSARGDLVFQQGNNAVITSQLHGKPIRKDIECNTPGPKYILAHVCLFLQLRRKFNVVLSSHDFVVN